MKTTSNSRTVRSFGSHCTGCGTLVPAETRYCSACAKKDFNVSPTASIETAPQTPPAYARPGVTPSPESDQ